MRAMANFDLDNPPQTIYLQAYGEDDPLELGGKVDLFDVCWCQDKIFNSDLEYRLVTKKRNRK
jgi:hypothetical protein